MVALFPGLADCHPAETGTTHDDLQCPPVWPCSDRQPPTQTRTSRSETDVPAATGKLPGQRALTPLVD